MTFYIHHTPLNGYVGQGGMGRKFSHKNGNGELTMFTYSDLTSW